MVYASDEVWANTDSSKCLYTYSEVSHGSRGGYVRIYGLASSGIPFSQACILVWNRLPGQMIAGYQYLYWDGASGACAADDGQLERHQLGWHPQHNCNFTADTGLRLRALPSLRGWLYGTKAASSVYYGGSWLRGRRRHLVRPSASSNP